MNSYGHQLWWLTEAAPDSELQSLKLLLAIELLKYSDFNIEIPVESFHIPRPSAETRILRPQIQQPNTESFRLKPWVWPQPSDLHTETLES